VPCPQCGEEIVVRRSRRGRLFYGCSGYPKCEFVVWKKPVARKCPQCGKPYLVESVTKRFGERLLCDDKECGYAEVVRAPDEMKAAARRA
jgi:DNA topoisomerase-1